MRLHSRLHSRPRCGRGDKTQTGRCAHSRQDRHHRFCIPRPRTDAKPLESGAHAGRIQQRIGRRCCCPHVRGIDWKPDWGSVGRPAAYNGLVSLVPTQTRVSMKNAFPLSWPLDHAGIFGRSAADVELQFGAIAEPYVEIAESKKPLRIGVIRDSSTTMPLRKRERFRTLSSINSPTRMVSSSMKPNYLPRLPCPSQSSGQSSRADVAAIHESMFIMYPNAYGPNFEN